MAGVSAAGTGSSGNPPLVWSGEHQGVACRQRLRVNVAVTACGLVSVSAHNPVPVHAPLQPTKVERVVLTAASLTVAPLWKFALQVAPH